MFSRHCKNSCVLQAHKGFTLIELMISVTIFSVIAVITFSAINLTFRVAESSQVKTTYLAQVQIGWHLISQDILHLAPRPVLIEGSYKSAWVEQSAHDEENMLVSFTRLGIPRIGLYPTENGLARVSYLLEDTSLYRLSWTYLDLQQLNKPQKSLVFTNIETVTFNAKFPPAQMNSSSMLHHNVKLYTMPASIIVTIKQQGKPEVTKYFPGLGTLVPDIATNPA